jgi:hypothetical protein
VGNWRTVQIIGSCKAAEVSAMRQAVEVGREYKNFDCLTYSAGLCGLPLWPSEAINAVGNLAERDYDAAAVKRHLEKLALIAPSLAVKVHCGGDYEDKACIATVTLKDGLATVGPPEIEQIPEPPIGQGMANFHEQMRRQSERVSRFRGGSECG